jgi:aryl-alcohol dehydrogenase-like predicted oxidoreductase
MNFRRLGNTDINCSVIGLGTGRLASVSGGASRSAAQKLFAVAEECGINLIDTADSYGQGECEKIIGRALQGRRDKFIISTKAGYCFSSLSGGLRFIKPLAKRVLKAFKGGRNLAGSVRSSVSRQDFKPEAIRSGIEASLQRLQTDHIDLFLLHSPPMIAMEDAQLFEFLRALKQQGKIRHFGVSSQEAAVLQSAANIRGLSVVQTPINPLHAANASILATLANAGIGIIANQIFISGKVISVAASSDSEAKEISAIKSRLKSLAGAKNISLNHLLIKYALGRPGVASALTGTSNAEHLKENVADALSAAALTAEEVSVISGEVAELQ